MGGRAGIVGAEEGKDGPVARRYGEYARCEVCQTVSLNVGVSRCGQSIRFEESQVADVSSCVIYRTVLRQYDLLRTVCSETSVYVGG